MIPPDPNPPPEPPRPPPVPTHPPQPKPASREPIDKRLATVRYDLENIFQDLQAVHDVVITVHKALLYQNGDQDGDFANVLQRCAINELYEQLLELTNVIEQLGGTTPLSEEIENAA